MAASRSSFAVDLDAANAAANFPFATQALRSPKVLSTGDYPTIVYKSRSVTRTDAGARVDGEITIRGVTQPLALDVVIYRQKGTEAGDLSRLSVLLTGSLQRSRFGAAGWGDLVGDRVDLKILARVSVAP